jgi:TubC N-terminal docking domain
MTAAVGLLQRLRAAGIDVATDADRLRLRSRTPLPPDLIELVRKHKPDLLALLAGDNPPNSGTAKPRARSEPGIELDGYRRVAFQRPPSWWRPQPHQPPNGAWCSCCHLRRWWTRDRLGWCCFICHPPARVGSDHFEEVRT